MEKETFKTLLPQHLHMILQHWKILNLYISGISRNHMKVHLHTLMENVCLKSCRIHLPLMVWSLSRWVFRWVFSIPQQQQQLHDNYYVPNYSVCGDDTTSLPHQPAGPGWILIYTLLIITTHKCATCVGFPEGWLRVCQP